MKCKRCGNSLPNDGIACKFCGTLMNQEQINYRNKMKDKDNERIVLLSEKYGHNNNLVYEKTKENKFLGLLIILFVLLIIVILAILINM